jgi:predicted dithiol-disulfide oxidoreductase (DUF899 family)
MAKHKTGSREEWLAERMKLLKAEKELTRQTDEIARRRQELPWVKIDKEYRFETDEGSFAGANFTAGGCELVPVRLAPNQSREAGDSVLGNRKASLADLFRGRSQLLVYHFMFGPDYKAGCPSCSAIADGFNGIAIHLANHDVMFWAVSRAPLTQLNEYKRRMNWTFPWASSAGTDFNFDFGASFTEEQQRKGIEYNYRREPATKPRGDAPKLSRSAPEGPTEFAAASGTDVDTYTRERPGVSAFALEDGVVYHTYSAYSRGVDSLWGMYQWLDRAPKGRNEDGGLWWKRHDEYEDKGAANGASRTGIKRSTSNAQLRSQKKGNEMKHDGASKDCCA